MKDKKKRDRKLQSEAWVPEEELLLYIKKILGKKFEPQSPFRSEKQKDLLRHFIETSSNTLVGIMPTNSGKSLIYQAGALYLGSMRKEKTIVISPLISLMLDQVVFDSSDGEEKNLFTMKNNFGFLVFNSTVRNLYPRYYKKAQEAYRSGRFTLVYVSPERFRSKPFLDIYKKQKITRFVIDEMHCVSIWGKSFRYEYKNLASIIRHHDPKLILLTASANNKMIKETVEQLKGKGAYKQADIVEKNIYREEIKINKPIKVANEEQRPRVTLKLIKNRIQKGGKVLVFTAFARENDKRKDAESLTEFYKDNAAKLGLKKNQIACYHAQMDPEERSIAQERFKNGRMKLLVATKAFGMGVDRIAILKYSIPDIRLLYENDVRFLHQFR